MEKKMDKKRNSSRSHEDVEGEPVAKKSRLVFKTIIYDESKANQWLDDPPLAVWDHMIIPFLGLKDLALSRHVCTFFEAYWQDKFENNVLPLRVGYDVATINQVMDVIEILSSRREYTKLNPFVVLLGEGDHEITISSGITEQYEPNKLYITSSNITFLGKGIDTTTILGEIDIIEVQNITFKQMTVSNTNGDGDGIYIVNSEVEITDVAIKRCGDNGLMVIVRSEEKLTHGLQWWTERPEEKEQVVLTRCQFIDNICGVGANNLSNIKMVDCKVTNNKDYGMFVTDKSTVHVHGEASAIHSNDTGIYASESSKVRIHLPSHHNTVYNNGGEEGEERDNRRTKTGATITNVED
jgi:hypothetical protein